MSVFFFFPSFTYTWLGAKQEAWHENHTVLHDFVT